MCINWEGGISQKIMKARWGCCTQGLRAGHPPCHHPSPHCHVQVFFFRRPYNHTIIILITRSPGAPLGQLCALRACLITSFTPFGRSGHVTHTTVQWWDSAFIKSFFFRFFCKKNRFFYIQNLFAVVLTPADLWYHSRFPRNRHLTVFVTRSRNGVIDLQNDHWDHSDQAADNSIPPTWAPQSSPSRPPRGIPQSSWHHRPHLEVKIYMLHTEEKKHICEISTSTWNTKAAGIIVLILRFCRRRHPHPHATVT